LNRRRKTRKPPAEAGRLIHALEVRRKPLPLDQEPNALLRIDSTRKVPIDRPTAGQGPIVVPTSVPCLISRIDHIVAQGAFRVPVAEQQDRTAIMTVGRPLARSGGIDISIETA